jgi:long-chain acyl-CoA synthetase
LDIFVQSALKVFKETPLEQIIIHSVFGMEAKLDLETGIPKPLIFNDLVSSHPWEEPPMAATVDDIAVLQYTSGATGTPKAAVLTHRNIVSNMFQINASMPQHAPENGAVICIIPFFHVFGMTVCMNISVFKGYRMVLLPRFDWSSVLSLMELIEKYRPYSFPAVPSLWAALVSHPEAQYFPLSDIWIPSSGGAPLPAWVQENYESLTGKKIMEAYGLSETASTTHINPLEKGGVTGSIGVPLPGTEAKIVDMETGEKACAVGEVGELIVRGPQVMQGYWKDPELTEKVLKGGWLYTGDLARVDENGFFYVVDRRDDLIISRGYNIYPSEVEKVLTRYPGVKQAAVVGIPDDIRGQSITAFVVREKSEITKEELLAHCREHLSDYKIPKAIWFRKQIPLNPAGKPLRRILRTEIPHGDPD